LVGGTAEISDDEFGRVQRRKMSQDEAGAGVVEYVVGSLPWRKKSTPWQTMRVVCTSVNVPHSSWCSSFQAQIVWVSTLSTVRRDVKALLRNKVKWIDNQEHKTTIDWLSSRNDVDLVNFEGKGPDWHHPVWTIVLRCGFRSVENGPEERLFCQVDGPMTVFTWRMRSWGV
jgi:hypothetical protein